MLYLFLRGSNVQPFIFCFFKVKCAACFRLGPRVIHERGGPQNLRVAGFPGSIVVTDPPTSFGRCMRHGSVPGLGRCPGVGLDNLLSILPEKSLSDLKPVIFLFLRCKFVNFHMNRKKHF